MGIWFHLRTRAVALLGLAISLAGLLLVLQLVVLLLWQYGIAIETRSWPRLPMAMVFADHAKLATTAVAPFLPFIPQLEWSWLQSPAGSSSAHTIAAWLLSKIHVGVAPALLGVPIALGGARVFLREISAVLAARRRKADRLRRVHAYRKEPTAEREPQFEYRSDPPDHRNERIHYRDERVDYRNEEVDHGNDRLDNRKEPFIGADVQARRAAR